MLFKGSPSGGSLEGNGAAKRETWRECALAGAICNTSEKGGEHTGRGRHLFHPWEVAWKKILRTEERGDFPKWKQLTRRTTRDFHYKIRGRERAPIYGIPTAPWPVAEAPMTLIKSRDISESSQVHLYRERLKGVCRSC